MSGMGILELKAIASKVEKQTMNMMRKGQIEGVEKGAVKERVKFMHQIFGVAA